MEPTKLSWGLGFTHNLGNFQSIRVDCTITDSARQGETAKDLSDRVYALVEKELVEKVNEAKAELESL